MADKMSIEQALKQMSELVLLRGRKDEREALATLRAGLADMREELDATTEQRDLLSQEVLRLKVEAVSNECGPVDIDIEFDKHYIPLPGGWEVQTKGKGSTFRIANTKTGKRLAIPESPYLHETLELMAREINAAVRQEKGHE